MSWRVFNSLIRSASEAVRGLPVVSRSRSWRVESSGWSREDPRISSREVMVLSPKSLFSGDARMAARAEEGSFGIALLSAAAADGSVFGFVLAGALSEVSGVGTEEIELSRRLVVVLGVSIQAPVTLGVFGSKGAWDSRDIVSPLSRSISGCDWE